MTYTADLAQTSQVDAAAAALFDLDRYVAVQADAIAPEPVSNSSADSAGIPLNPPSFPVEKLLETGVYLPNQKLYINGLELLPKDERYGHGAVALGVMMVNRKTGERLMIDLLSPGDRFATVLRIIRLHFPSSLWLLTGETWETA